MNFPPLHRNNWEADDLQSGGQGEVAAVFTNAYVTSFGLEGPEN